MESLTRTSVECALFLIYCLTVVPTITTPTQDLGLNSENTLPISRFHYPGDDSPNKWNYDYPRFYIPQSAEEKRRSSFFPVRGKKVGQNIHHPQSGAPTGYSVIDPGSTSTDGRTFVPIVRGIPSSFYDVSHNVGSYIQRFQNEAQQAVENAPGVFDVTGSWPQEQKRPSSFMPMRGRKQYMNGDNMQLLNRYLTARGNPVRLAFGNDDMKKDHTDFSGRDLPVLSIKEVENEDTAINSKSSSSEKMTPTKRALSFVPTRGRRGKSQEFVSEFLPHLTVPQMVADLPEALPAGHIGANLSRYIYEEDGKSHQRYRRKSAFLPMRGRKSSGTPYWLAYNFLPQYVDQVQRSRDLETRNSIEKMEQQSSEDSNFQEMMFSDDRGGRKQKKSFGSDGLPSSVSQQKLRTAVVMKRPLSFFAARGKRLNAD